MGACVRMKAWIGAVFLVAANHGVLAQSATSAAAHDAHHQQPPSASAFSKHGPPPREKRKRGVSPGYARQWRAALAMGDQGDAAQADRALAKVMADREFAALTAGEQRVTWSRAAWMAIRQDDFERARERVSRAIGTDPSDPDDLYLLAQLEDHQGNREAAARHLRDLALRWPRMLDRLDTGAVLRIARQAPDAAPVRVQLLEALLHAAWDGNGMGVGDLWYLLALDYQARGDADGVRRAVALTTSPQALVKFRADRRFDALLDRRDATLDIAAAARRRVDHLRRLATERPRSLEVRMELTYAQLALGRYAEVVSLADETLAALSNAPADALPFDDPDHAVWILNNRAIAMRGLGRLNDAQADLVRASGMDEAGGANVGPMLNLGQFLCQRGRPDEARAMIERVGDMSGYGRMVQASIQHCAAVQQNDAVVARRALDYLRDHHEDAREIWIWALVEAGRMDDAAQALIAALDAPASRGDMLAALQDYLEPAPLPAFEPVRKRWRALLAREDVRQAVAKVGRIEHQPVFNVGGI